MALVSQGLLPALIVGLYLHASNCRRDASAEDLRSILVVHLQCPSTAIALSKSNFSTSMLLCQAILQTVSAIPQQVCSRNASMKGEKDSSFKDVSSKKAWSAGLTHLKISKPYTFCDRGYSHLASLTKLNSLELGHSWMLGTGHEGIGFIASMTLLRKLSITKCFVQDDGLQALSSLVNLQLLGICESNRITGQCFPSTA